MISNNVTVYVTKKHKDVEFNNNVKEDKKDKKDNVLVKRKKNRKMKNKNLLNNNLKNGNINSLCKITNSKFLMFFNYSTIRLL